MDNHIFISYRNIKEDTELALKLAADLKSYGLNVWVDKLDIAPQDDWRMNIEQAVNAASGMICVLSPDYLTSKYCRREMSRADDLNLPIFPLLLRHLDRKEWPLEVQREQYVDFQDWHNPKEYVQKVNELILSIKGKVSGQFHVNLSKPKNTYVYSLIAELESRRGILEYVDLSTTEQQDSSRPSPYHDESWEQEFALLTEDYIPHRGQTSIARRYKSPVASIKQAMAQYKKFVLVGEPGAGKTTTLRKLVLDNAREALSTTGKVPLPFLLYLPTWGDEASPEEFIRTHWVFDDSPDAMLSRGEVVLYLDGLNEMGMSGILKANKLKEWLKSKNAPNNVVITCRTADYAGALNLGLPTILVEEMDEPRIRQFAVNYLGTESGQTFLKRILPEKGKNRESGWHLMRLARNPYLLTALIVVYKSSPNGDLPRNSGALFRKLARVLWEREQKRFTLTELSISFEDSEKAFSRLAFSMIDNDMPIDVSYEYALSCLDEKKKWIFFNRTSGVGNQLIKLGHSANFIEAKESQLRFYHQLVQEYFAAVRLVDYGIIKKLQIPKFDQSLAIRIATKWDQVVISACGIIPDPSDAVSQIAKNDPWLAAECIESGITVSAASYNIVVEKLFEALTGWDDGSRETSVKSLIDIGNALVVPELLRIMQDERIIVRKAAHKVLIEIKDEIAAPSFINALDHKDADIRYTAAKALGKVRSLAAVPELILRLNDQEKVSWASNYVYDAAAEALECIGTPEALDAVRAWHQ